MVFTTVFSLAAAAGATDMLVEDSVAPWPQAVSTAVNSSDEVSLFISGYAQSGVKSRQMNPGQ